MAAKGGTWRDVAMLADGVLGAARRQGCVVRNERGASDFGAQVEPLRGPHVPTMDALAVSSASSPALSPGSVAVVDSAGPRAYTPLQRWNCNVANDPTIDDAVDPQRGLQ